jgi:hypothetical protein
VEAVFETAANSSACFQPAITNADAYCCGTGCNPSTCGAVYYGSAATGVFTAAGAPNFCAYTAGASSGNILRNFAVKDPTFSAGVSLALTDVYDAATSSFVAPRAGLYSLGYTLYVGLPFWTQEDHDTYPYKIHEFVSGSAEIWVNIEGARELVERLDSSARSFNSAPKTRHDFTGFPQYPTLYRYLEPVVVTSVYKYTSVFSAGSRQHVRGGAWSGYLAAGAKVSAELTFRGYQGYSDLGLLWLGSRLRFSCVVPY